ncbi:MAG TPA: phosphate ABC transporter substrate-binding protein PstS [Polyangiaceae bacterium]
MLPAKMGAMFATIALALSVFGCKKAGGNQEQGEKPGKDEAPAPETAKTVTLQGSGASFPAPIYSRWFKEFSNANPDVRVNYQATGSGAGVKAFTEGQTDFGASDAAMTDEEIKAAKDNVIMLPITAGNIVLAYNLTGIENLKLSRDAYSGIFLGEIKKWNDPKIAKVNPDVKLPDQNISVVRRSDGSGTTFVFTTHLAAISEKWKAGPGAGKSIDWPVGVGGRQNAGVAALIQQTPGAIGYVEYAFSVSSKQPMAVLENKAGKYVVPTLAAASTALARVELPADMRAWAPDPEGDEAYPIVSYSWILAKKKYDDPTKANAVKKLLNWCLTDGQKLSESLHYVPLPGDIATKVAKAAETIQ